MQRASLDNTLYWQVEVDPFPSLWDQGIRFLLANIGCCQGRLSALDSVLLGGNINMGWHHRFHGHGDAC